MPDEAPTAVFSSVMAPTVLTVLNDLIPQDTPADKPGDVWLAGKSF